MVELETRIAVGDWQGVARAYASPDAVRQAAKLLQRWSRQPEGQVEFEAGADTGIGWLRLRFYPADHAGHLVCHVQLATGGPTGGRPSEARLSLAMRTEPGLVERFARRLKAIVAIVGEEAALLGVLA
ncbi:MAG: hypothetical protein ACHRHE_16445 [Tepidisphaerales bacterium]